MQTSLHGGQNIASGQVTTSPSVLSIEQW